MATMNMVKNDSLAWEKRQFESVSITRGNTCDSGRQVDVLRPKMNGLIRDVTNMSGLNYRFLWKAPNFISN